VIWSLARFAALLTVARPVKIDESMFCSTFAFSTFTQFGAVGTKKLDFDAFANGASCGFFALTESNDVVFGICLPIVASWRIELVLVKILIQS
jgi:hypothetical protein